MADSHLGFSAYRKVDQWGRNRQEELVYEGFKLAIDKIINDIHPDAVIHAGDVFHHVRPRIRPLYVFKRELGRLVDEGISTIIINGNHDAPKSSATASPFSLFEGLKDVHIAHDRKYHYFEVGDHIFHCIPFCLDEESYLKQFSEISPSGADVLVMHGLSETLRNKRLRTVGEHEISDNYLKSYFSYIALGHYHSQMQIARNAWYSGSIEHFNFGEALDKKGILLIDLESNKVEPIEIIPKYMIDIPIDCNGLSSSEINKELITFFEQEVVEDKVIRINLNNVTRAAYRNIDQSKLAKLSSSSLYFKIKAEYVDQTIRKEETIDTFRLHEEFSKFLEEEIARGSVPKAIQKDVVAYGTGLIRKTVEARNTEALNAPE